MASNDYSKYRYSTQDRDYMPQLRPGLEALYALGSGALAEPVAGLYGIANLPFGADVAAQALICIRRYTAKQRPGMYRIEEICLFLI